MENHFDAVLLASFGGPEGPQDVMPFLERVTAGRGVPRARLEEVSHHYLALGGVSPINAQNRELIAALHATLSSRGTDVPIYFGNRNSAPYFAQALAQIHAEGHRRVLTLATSAYSSYSGCRQYREDLALALEQSKLAGELEVVKIRPFYDRAGMAKAKAAGLLAALRELDQLGIAAAAARLLCTTHSLPVAMAATSGPPQLRPGSGADVYSAQHRQLAAEMVALAESAGLEVPPWHLVYQSRSGPPHVPWLEPDINDALRDAAAAGVQAVLVAPIGFISDHVEVIWDLDHEARETATELGLHYLRLPTAGLAREFVGGLADVIESNLRDAPDRQSPLCSADCCPNLRRELPSVPGTGTLG